MEAALKMVRKTEYKWQLLLSISGHHREAAEGDGLIMYLQTAKPATQDMGFSSYHHCC